MYVVMLGNKGRIAYCLRFVKEEFTGQKLCLLNVASHSVLGKRGKFMTDGEYNTQKSRAVKETFWELYFFVSGAWENKTM